MSKPPAALKPIHPYLLLHKTFKDRDPIVSYYGKGYGERVWGRDYTTVK